MQMKIYTVLLLAALILACKPAAQATVQSSATSAAPSSATLDQSAKDALSENDLTAEDRQWRKERPEGITDAFYACIKEINYVTIGITNCASDEKSLQDARLNKIYKELLATLDHEHGKALVEAERSWLVWKNNEELFEQVVYSSEQMDNAELELREMERLARRADELEHYKANIELRKP